MTHWVVRKHSLGLRAELHHEASLCSAQSGGCWSAVSPGAQLGAAPRAPEPNRMCFRSRVWTYIRVRARWHIMGKGSGWRKALPHWFLELQIRLHKHNPTNKHTHTETQTQSWEILEDNSSFLVDAVISAHPQRRVETHTFTQTHTHTGPLPTRQNQIKYLICDNTKGNILNPRPQTGWEGINQTSACGRRRKKGWKGLGQRGWDRVISRWPHHPPLPQRHTPPPDMIQPPSPHYNFVTQSQCTFIHDDVSQSNPPRRLFLEDSGHELIGHLSASSFGIKNCKIHPQNWGKIVFD